MLVSLYALLLNLADTDTYQTPFTQKFGVPLMSFTQVWKENKWYCFTALNCGPQYFVTCTPVTEHSSKKLDAYNHDHSPEVCALQKCILVIQASFSLDDMYKEQSINSRNGPPELCFLCELMGKYTRLMKFNGTRTSTSQTY